MSETERCCHCTAAKHEHNGSALQCPIPVYKNFKANAESGQAPGSTPESLRRMLDYATGDRPAFRWNALTEPEQQAVRAAYKETDHEQ